MESRYDPLSNKVELLPVVLPSDCNLRADVLYWKKRSNSQANKYKMFLENVQRRDKKLRQGKIIPEKAK